MQNNYYDYLYNNYFTSNTLEDLYKQIVSKEEQQAYVSALAIYNALSKDQLYTDNEKSLEDVFTSKILTLLGYSYQKEYSLSVQGKQYRLDYLLFDSDANLKKFLHLPTEDRDLDKHLLVESKASTAKLDTKKVDINNNPHYQITNYLVHTGCRYGFLTNANYWRLYDAEARFHKKVYIELNLYKILQDNYEAGFYLFYRLFNVNYYFKQQIEITKAKDKLQIESIEARLANVIYGTEQENFTDSALEKIGSALYSYHKNNSDLQLTTIFHDSTILMFRFIFLFYYESKFRDTLINHRAYKKYSIYEFYRTIIMEDTSINDDFNIYGDLLEFFEKLAKGNSNQEIPMLNGGLFDINKAPLLQNKEIFSNKVIKDIFNSMLLYKTQNDDLFSQMQQDYSLIDIKKLGEIYENLLEYEFRIATKDTYLVKYNDGKINNITFCDDFDLSALRKSFKDTTEYAEYKEGTLYLVSLSNNRKQTASYYTPESFTKFMVISALDNQIEQGKNLLELQIIDNACGSGHFLVDALSELCSRCINSEIPEVKTLIEEEKAKIASNLAEIGIKDI
jgi:hypothetical protein